MSDGPPPGHTGGFGEPTCAACHQPPSASRQPVAELSGLPERYVPGASYELTLTVTAPSLRRAGFQLAARHQAATAAAGRQAGTFSVSADPMRTALTVDSALRTVYIHHTWEGTGVAAGGPARWRLRWTAPRSGGAVVFHGAAVVASDDNSPLDDEVVTVSRVTLAPIPPGP